MAINAELERLIVKRLFADAESFGWQYLSGDRRSAVYTRWMEEPEVGGRLTQFLTPQKARLWIKDGPMKEYARARYGVGKYAEHVVNPAAGVDDLIRRTLGSDWKVVPDSRKVKPLRVRISDGESERHFTWAPADQLKHLVWAAVKAEALGDAIPWTLCLVGSFEKPIPADQREFDRRIGARCQLQVIHVDDL